MLDYEIIKLILGKSNGISPNNIVVIQSYNTLDIKRDIPVRYNIQFGNEIYKTRQVSIDIDEYNLVLRKKKLKCLMKK